MSAIMQQCLVYCTFNALIYVGIYSKIVEFPPNYFTDHGEHEKSEAELIVAKQP